MYAKGIEETLHSLEEAPQSPGKVEAKQLQLAALAREIMQPARAPLHMKKNKIVRHGRAGNKRASQQKLSLASTPSTAAW